MNERAAPPPQPGRPAPRPPQPGRPAPLSITGRDREFLPAALEILETPPAPLPVVLMLTICAFVAAALAWSFIGRLDVHAVAPGKIETAGRAKVIEPLDPGKIAAIHVDDGSRVKIGDLLLELDPAEAAADENAARDALNASLAEIARRRFAIDTVRAVLREPPPQRQSEQDAALSQLEAVAADAEGRIAWDDAVPAAFRLREQAVLAADLTQLADTLKNLDKQMAQKEATRERLRMSIAFQDTLIETLTQRARRRST
jgi:hemolysin D